MPDALYSLILNLPLCLLLAALLVEAFVLCQNNRDAEPAVLWLFFCSVGAAGLVVLWSMVVYFWKHDASRLTDAFWALAVAAAASLAWLFKRQGRNRGLLLLRERFFSADPSEPPKPKSGQFFWILGWRVLAVAALAAGIGSLWLGRPGVNSSPSPTVAEADSGTGERAAENGVSETSPPAPAPELAASPAASTPPENSSSSTNVPPVETPPNIDPTKAELPPAEASALAATVAATIAPAAPTEPVMPAPPAPTPVVTPPPAAPAPEVRPVSRNSAYFTKVRPIFARACTKCHGVEKQKGDLALHSPDAIRAGANGKPVIVPGNPEKSRLFAVICLPQDDPDFMPQKGSPLSSTDKKTISEWIKAGADLGDGVSIPGSGGGIFVVDTISAALPEPDAKVLENLQSGHVIVRPLSKNKRVVEIDFSHSDRAQGPLKLEDLAPIALHVFALDFSRTKVTDADLAHLAGMRNLTRLILSKTEIGDAGLAHLKSCAALEQINLYKTMVTDAGLAHLTGLKALKKVYLWESKATAAGAALLKESIPGVEVSLGNETIVKPPPPAMGNNRR